MRILVIEDSEDILYLMKIDLEQMGYSVLVAKDGTSGLEIAQRERPDLIISDIKMPGIDGYDLIKSLRSMDELASTPVIALTGFDRKKDAEQALSAGYNAHLSKPVDLGKLSALIEALTAQQKKK